MGARGPIPKRSTERAGHRAKDDVPDRTAGDGPVPIPAESRDWHVQAKRLYRALRHSAQRRYFEPSDWAQAQLLCDLLTRELTKKAVAHLITGDVIVKVPPGALMMKTILAGFAELGTTESSRRRMRIEIDRPPAGAGRAPGAGDVSITVLDDYRAAVRE